MNAFALRGADAGALLDWLHVHAEVLGAAEQGAEITVWLGGDMPVHPFAKVDVQELGPEAKQARTGTERDAPILVARDLLVRPPWVDAFRGFRGIELVVPRGMAFGSGEHASTKAALLALHESWSDPASFADVGTGSGILLAYAAARGCTVLCACDVEAEAVAAARALVPGAEVVRGGPDRLPRPGDCVVANLTCEELHTALDDILAQWTQRAPLVLSGMRETEVGGVARKLPFPVRVIAVGEFRAAVCQPTR